MTCSSNLDARITDGGKLTLSYSVESGGEVETTKQAIIELIQGASFESLKRETVYDHVETVGI